MTMQKNHHQMEIQKDPLRNVYVKKHIHDTTSKLIIGKQAFPFWGLGMPIFKGSLLFCFQGVGEWQLGAMGLVWDVLEIEKNLWDVPDRKMPRHGQSK